MVVGKGFGFTAVFNDYRTVMAQDFKQTHARMSKNANEQRNKYLGVTQSFVVGCRMVLLDETSLSTCSFGNPGQRFEVCGNDENNEDKMMLKKKKEMSRSRERYNGRRSITTTARGK
jgi:hypothetical protein